MKRGKKSADELALPTVTTETHLAPVAGLSADECDLWLETVNRLPASWFPPESGEMLAAYVRHACAARDLARMIEGFSPEWVTVEGGLERLDRLLKMRDRETRAMLACARSLRITNQARQDPKTAGRAARNYLGADVRLPWDYGTKGNNQ